MRSGIHDLISPAVCRGLYIGARKGGGLLLTRTIRPIRSSRLAGLFQLIPLLGAATLSSETRRILWRPTDDVTERTSSSTSMGDYP
jgi:hypothetical protein